MDANISSGGGAIDVSGTPSTNEYARWTDADTLEGRSTSDVLSDIGAQASGNYITGTGSLSAQDLTDIGNLSGTNTGDGTFGIANTNSVKIDAADVADDDYARFTANGLEGRTLAEIKSDIGTGNSALVPAAGSSGEFLAHNGAFAQVAYSNLSGTPTIPAALNDLSDVSYSSGDLTITGLDKIIGDDIVLDSSADITLDAASGAIIAKKGGAEYSAANSAYAGMILGYTYIQPSSTVLSFEIQNALTVEDDGHKITFKTPPSAKVEIEVTAMINCSSSDTRISVGLSSANATDGYSSVAGQFEYDSSGIFFTDDEVDDHVKTFKFVLEAANLAAVGSDNTFWIGFSTSNSTKTAYLTYGYRSSHGIANHPFIIKATALPATIYDGS